MAGSDQGTLLQEKRVMQVNTEELHGGELVEQLDGEEKREIVWEGNKKLVEVHQFWAELE